MQALRLTLKGFRGIRDGLGRDSLTLDFERLADGAQLVALAGANGRGKTTVMDNMHPYLTMPSRAAVAGPGGFSYYDHVFLPESEKDLTWTHEGRCYRSHVVVRSNGRRRTEAFLFQLDDNGAWRPVVLDDGTVADGKVDIYTRCVEALCGSADTFFTSVFSAQGKRQLSAYRNGEIKSLLADLLGQDEIRAQGQRAAETARLFKASLAAMRQALAGLQEEGERIANERQRLEGAPDRVARGLAHRQAAQATLESARHRQAQSLAQQERSRSTEAQRTQLQIECRAANQAGLQAIDALEAQDRGEQQRQERLQQRIAQRAAQQRSRWQTLQDRRRACLGVLARAAAVRRAERRLPMAELVLQARAARVTTSRQQLQDLNECLGTVRAAQQRLVATVREAGQAAIRADDLGRRFGLTNAVPCVGTDLQGHCQLLGDAREARALIPGAQSVIARLAGEKASIELELVTLRARCQALAGAPQQLGQAERACERARARVARLAQQAARSDEIARAHEALSGLDQELAETGPALTDDGQPMETPEERAERLQIHATRQQIARRIEQQSQQLRTTLDRLHQALAAMQAPFDAQALADAQAAMERASLAAAAADQVHIDALRDAEALAALALQARALSDRQSRAASRIAAVETELSNWNLFARCMSNDGLIALAIDDAGPALSGLANDLLLACYGTRFTVSILTLLETGRGEQKEGFDTVVHDGESGQSKSVALMSGGERVWISCRSRHEIHYAENPDMPSSRSGRRPRPCNCAAGTCEAMRHNTSVFGTIGPDARGGKSLSLMSGGERTFIDACLTRAIALYLAQNTGRRFDTLFSDEADGPLDPEHKRMFMAMKREVLRLGGYRQEFFITQTPHLATMADAI